MLSEKSGGNGMAEDNGYSGTEDRDGQGEEGKNTSSVGDKVMLSGCLGCLGLFIFGLFLTVWLGYVLMK